MVLDIAVANQVFMRSQVYSIRQATIEDLAQISAIENNTSAYPCSYQQLHDCIESIYLLIGDYRLLGFAVIVTVEKQAELHTIAIEPQEQGKGLGSLFLKL